LGTCGTSPNRYPCIKYRSPNPISYYYQDQEATGCGSTTLLGRKVSFQPIRLPDPGKTTIDKTCTDSDGPDIRIQFKAEGATESCDPANPDVRDESACTSGWLKFTPDTSGKTAKLDWAFNPCACKPDHYEIVIEASDGSASGFTKFAPPSGDLAPLANLTIPGDPKHTPVRCVVPWYKSADFDGVTNIGTTKWGRAGRNGHWVLTGGIVDGKAVPESTTGIDSGWSFNPVDCQFRCDGNKSGALCYNTVLQPQYYFVPDLRTIVLNDPAGTATTKKGRTANDYNHCGPSVGSQEVSSAPATPYLPGNTKYFVNGSLYSNIASKLNTNPYYLSTMHFGEELSNAYGVGSDLSTLGEFYNTAGAGYDTGTGATTVDCTCPSISLNDSTSGDTSELGECSYNFSPSNYSEVCTTKRTYVRQNNCYSSAWWQVSGGNVYAREDIINRVPNNSREFPSVPISMPSTKELITPAYPLNILLPTKQASKPVSPTAKSFPQIKATAMASPLSCKKTTTISSLSPTLPPLRTSLLVA
jgi:hypothetical protein